MDALSIICLLMKLLGLWFHSVCGSLCFVESLSAGHIIFVAGHIFAGYIFSNFVTEIGLLLVSKTSQCELFCSYLSAFAFIDRNLLRSLQSCFSMIGILCPPLCGLLCPHLSDWILFVQSFGLPLSIETITLSVSLAELFLDGWHTTPPA
jgi:hypothetical protein